MVVSVADFVAKVVRGRLQTVVWDTYLVAKIRGRLQMVVCVADLVKQIRGQTGQSGI